MKERICILMSTYNGERFLYEQLESICSQEVDADILVYIRDDGSTDNTASVIRQYIAINKCSNVKIELLEEENVGVHKSFLKLLYKAPEADYYAFCDQDDYWKPQKLQIAISTLRSINAPSLFYSGYEVVDSNLNHICNEPILGESSKSVTQILFQNRVPGCVMVFNRQLFCELLRVKEIEAVRMHDGYLMCVAFLTGKIIHVTDCLIKYRQHTANALGYGSKHQGVKDWIQSKLNLLRYGDGYDVSMVARKLLAVFGEVCSLKQKRDLTMIAEYKHSIFQKIKLLCSKDIKSMSYKSSTISIFCRIFFNVI